MQRGEPSVLTLGTNVVSVFINGARRLLTVLLLLATFFIKIKASIKFHEPSSGHLAFSYTYCFFY